MKNILNEEELRSVSGAGISADHNVGNSTHVRDEDILNEMKLPDFDLV